MQTRPHTGLGHTRITRIYFQYFNDKFKHEKNLELLVFYILMCVDEDEGSSCTALMTGWPSSSESLSIWSYPSSATLTFF